VSKGKGWLSDEMGLYQGTTLPEFVQYRSLEQFDAAED
jgi:hypothetical protein